MENLEYDNLQPKEVEALSKILAESFFQSSAETAKNILATGPHHYRVAKSGGNIVGGLGILEMGQWFGGKKIPMAGITAVGVAPSHRGKGVASFLLQKTLKELKSAGFSLSALYPSTLELYQKAGYQRAGRRITFSLSLWALPRKKYPSVKWQEASPCDYTAIYQIYREKARGGNGNLDRAAILWEKILEPRDKEVYSYLILEKTTPRGYVIFSQVTPSNKLYIRDMAFLTPESGRGLISFLSAHKTTASAITWSGGLRDPLIHLLPEVMEHIESHLIWMIRMVDVKNALSQRGYPQNLKAELHLQISDSLLFSNRGKFILQIKKGEGRVKSGGKAQLKMDITALAPLYCSFLSATELSLLGEVEGAPSALALADMIFAGPSPSMPDYF